MSLRDTYPVSLIWPIYITKRIDSDIFVYLIRSTHSNNPSAFGFTMATLLFDILFILASSVDITRTEFLRPNYILGHFLSKTLHWLSSPIVLYFPSNSLRARLSSHFFLVSIPVTKPNQSPPPSSINHGEQRSPSMAQAL